MLFGSRSGYVLLQLFSLLAYSDMKLEAFSVELYLQISTVIWGSHISACVCCLIATNVFSLTEGGTEVILCHSVTDTGHFVSERISGKMSQ